MAPPGLANTAPPPGSLTPGTASAIQEGRRGDRADNPGWGGASHPTNLEEVYKLCRDLGMRLSRQRRMVLDLLWAERSHLSARDIFEKLNNLGRNIGHTSVYQNLEALQSAGVIECLDRASGRLYGYRADPHSHLTCMDSGSITDLDVVLPPELLRQIEACTGYMIETYTLHFTGRRHS
jgi:Fur family ferric uptake transcriptional regulator